MTALALAALLSSGVHAQAPAAAPAPASAAAKVSTAAAVAQSTQTVGSLYTGDRVRDPFLPAVMGAGPSVRRSSDNKDEPPPPVDIHLLQLRGILKDANADYALFSYELGGTMLLKAGKLYDDRNKPVKGVTGKILLKQKTVQLVTADKDVQIFRIGEKDEDKDNEKKAP